MPDDLRTRIAAVQAQHHHWDYAGALTCACGEDFGLDGDAGWEAAVAGWADHVTDAVIRELGLRTESRKTWVDFDDGHAGGYPHPHRQTRYVTDWIADD